MEVPNKDLLYKHMQLCSNVMLALDGRGVWGRIDTHICLAKGPSLFT